jgi:hypothetical protein
MAILFLAIGCGRTIAESDGTSREDAGEAAAAARDASEAVDAPDAPETSLPDARPDVGPCPSDVIFMAVQADDVNSTTTLQTFRAGHGRRHQARTDRLRHYQSERGLFGGRPNGHRLHL